MNLHRLSLKSRNIIPDTLIEKRTSCDDREISSSIHIPLTTLSLRNISREANIKQNKKHSFHPTSHFSLNSNIYSRLFLRLSAILKHELLTTPFLFSSIKTQIEFVAAILRRFLFIYLTFAQYRKNMI